MKIVVLGGAGLVGSKVVELLDRAGHDVIAASRRTGVDVYTGQGLAAALDRADVAVDVVNSPSFEGDVAVDFFEASTRNILAAETAAGVKHHIALSIVGAERLSANGYFRAKLAQERLVEATNVPHTILRATQFFEFLERIVQSSMQGNAIRVAPARVHPIAAHDVAAAVAAIADSRAINDIIELAGPDFFRLDQLVRYFMLATSNEHEIISDPDALYFGTKLTDETLVAGENPRFGHTDFDAWVRRYKPRRVASVTGGAINPAA